MSCCVAVLQHRSAASVALKYLVQSGHPFVTASGLTQYDQEDLALFDWELSGQEMSTLTNQTTV